MYRGAGWAHSKEFFTEIEARNYFAALHSKMKSEVEQMSDAEIVSCNFQEWADYLADKYSIVPISIFETNIETKVLTQSIDGETEKIIRYVDSKTKELKQLIDEENM